MNDQQVARKYLDGLCDNVKEADRGRRVIARQALKLGLATDGKAAREGEYLVGMTFHEQEKFLNGIEDGSSKYGWGEDLEDALELLAETPTTKEQVGVVQDAELDLVILAARRVIAREKRAQEEPANSERSADRVDGYDRDDIGLSPDY